MAWYALGDPTFRKVVGTKLKRVPWAPPVHVKEYRNHNRMLFGYSGTYGVKTGFTTKAGACLVVAVRRGNRSVIGVLLGSRDIWGDMPRLIDATLNKRARDRLSAAYCGRGGAASKYPAASRIAMPKYSTRTRAAATA